MKKIIILLLLLPLFSEAQSLITIGANRKTPLNDSTYQLSFKFKIPVPLQLMALPNKQQTLKSYMPLYSGLSGIENDTVVFRFTEQFWYSQSDSSIFNYLQIKYNNYVNGLNAITVPTPDYLNGEKWNGTQWVCPN